MECLLPGGRVQDHAGDERRASGYREWLHRVSIAAAAAAGERLQYGVKESFGPAAPVALFNCYGNDHIIPDYFTSAAVQ